MKQSLKPKAEPRDRLHNTGTNLRHRQPDCNYRESNTGKVVGEVESFPEFPETRPLTKRHTFPTPPPLHVVTLLSSLVAVTQKNL